MTNGFNFNQHIIQMTTFSELDGLRDTLCSRMAWKPY